MGSNSIEPDNEGLTMHFHSSVSYLSRQLKDPSRIQWGLDGEGGHPTVTLEYSLSEQQWFRWALSLIHLKACVTSSQISKLS